MPKVRTHHLQLVQWGLLVATVAATPLVFSRWTFDVFSITELTALWVGVSAAAALRITTLVAGDRLSAPPMTPVVAAYVVVITLSVITSRAPVVSFFGNYARFGGLSTTLAVIALGWMAWERMSGRPDRQHQLLSAVALSSAIGAVYLIAQELDLDAVEWLRPDGVSPKHSPGMLGNSNFSGAHVALGVGPSAWLASQSHGRGRAAWIGVLGVCLAGTAVSQSRGAMLAVAVTLLVAAAHIRVGVRRLALIAAAVLALVGVVALATSNNGFTDLVDPTTSDERADLWQVALRGAPDHLVLGGGPDLYLLTFREHAGPELEGVFADEPHNVLLDHLDGSGLLGAAAWLALLGAVVAAVRRSRRTGVTPWLLMGVAYLTQAMVSIDAVPLLLWAWVALAGVEASSTERRSPPTRDRITILAPLGGLVLAVVAAAFLIQPFRADMAYRRGVQASNLGDAETAEAQFLQAIDRHGWQPRYHARLGLERWGAADLSDPTQLAETRQPLLDALDLFPGDPSANAWLSGVDARAAELAGSD